MKRTLLVFLILILLNSLVYGQSGYITTFAGTGTSGFSGDGGPASAATMSYPFNIFRSSAGDIYFSDQGNYRVRKISTSGIISTIIGNGIAGYTGDSGPATAAEISAPSGDITMDASGNIYIADQNNQVIRKVNISGIISTYAGTGYGCCGGGGGFSGDGGPATAAEFSSPSGMVSDTSGNIYIAERFNHRVRKVNSSGIVSTIAGSGPTGIGGGSYSGDGGPATNARLNNPWQIAMDYEGNLYIADLANSRIRKVNNTGIISTIAGTGTDGFSGDGGQATAAQIYVPSGMVFDHSGNLYFADGNNERIRKIAPSGIITTIGGSGTMGYSGDGGPATAANLHFPVGIVIDNSGYVYFTDEINQRIRKISPNPFSPSFIGGHTEFLTVCENSVFNTINSLLAVYDSTSGYTETWSLLSGPAHGSAAVAYVTSTTGGILTPSGLSYTPASGYYGTDSFKVRVSDGIHSDTTKIIVTVTRFDAGIITGPSSLCVGSTITLADTTSGGTWSSSNTAVATIGSSGVVTAIAGGSTIISYTVTSSCGTVSALSIIGGGMVYN